VSTANFKYRALTIEAFRRETQRDENSTTRRTVPDGQFIGDVEVFLDDRLLRKLAERALRNKSRRAAVGSGLIICKARNVRHEGGKS
jgi:hypothetical protein